MLSKGVCMATAKQPDKQLNIRIKPKVYRRLQAAAKRERVTVTAFSRAAIMDHLEGGPAGAGSVAIPSWLLSALLFLVPRRK